MIRHPAQHEHFAATLFSPPSLPPISHVSTKGSAAASALSTVGLATTTLAADTPTRMLLRKPALLVGGVFGLAVMVNPEHRTSIISTRAAEEAIIGRVTVGIVVLCYELARSAWCVVALSLSALSAACEGVGNTTRGGAFSYPSSP